MLENPRVSPDECALKVLQLGNIDLCLYITVLPSS